jgi:glycine/D-amino acid oxidase-like deaminating enzyme
MLRVSSVQHYGAAGTADDRQLDVTFTATTSASGTLLLGSSREFCGFDGQPDTAVVHGILQRAEAFLPGVSGVSMADVSVRVGLRPYAARGLPYVGPVPGVQGLFVAAGHEGSGLSLAPATGQLLSALILEHDAAELVFASDLAII